MADESSYILPDGTIIPSNEFHTENYRDLEGKPIALGSPKNDRTKKERTKTAFQEIVEEAHQAEKAKTLQAKEFAKQRRMRKKEPKQKGNHQRNDTQNSPVHSTSERKESPSQDKETRKQKKTTKPRARNAIDPNSPIVSMYFEEIQRYIPSVQIDEVVRVMEESDSLLLENVIQELRRRRNSRAGSRQSVPKEEASPTKTENRDKHDSHFQSHPGVIYDGVGGYSMRNGRRHTSGGLARYISDAQSEGYDPLNEDITDYY